MIRLAITYSMDTSDDALGAIRVLGFILLYKVEPERPHWPDTLCE